MLPSEDLDERVAAELAESDQRYTRGRRRLVGLLADAGRPLTAPELLERDADLTQSSLYRNLDLLEQVGLVRRVNVGPTDHARYELSEPLLGHHHHLICLRCGVAIDVHLSDTFEHEIDTTLHQAASAAGFEALNHTLDVHGFCSNCR